MLPYSEPKVEESIGRLTYLWADYDLKVIADRITDAGTAELWFYHTNSTGDSLLELAKINLLFRPSKTAIEKKMANPRDDIPWAQIVTYISKTAMEYTRRGEPGVMIEPSEGGAVHPGYYIEPVIMKGVNNTIYGDKGSNKTTIGLTMLGIIALGSMESECGLIAPDPAKVAMLDWEVNDKLTNYTLSRLISGQSIPWYPLPYLRCKQPLIDDIDRIANFLHDNHADVVMIDSLEQAAGSDRFDSSGKGAALKFFEALRQLNITALIIGQNAKNEEGKKSIFGSTYFTYYSRNIFELRGKQDDLDENQMHVALFQQESNYSKKYRPMGFNLTYTDSTIKIVSESVSLSAFMERASKTKELLEFLSDGSKSLSAITEELELPNNRVRTLLSQLKKRKLVVNLSSGMWGRGIENVTS